MSTVTYRLGGYLLARRQAEEMATAMVFGEDGFEWGVDYADAIGRALDDPEPVCGPAVDDERARGFLREVLDHLPAPLPPLCTPEPLPSLSPSLPPPPRLQRATDAEYEPDDPRGMLAAITHLLPDAPLDERSVHKLADLIIERKYLFNEGRDQYVEVIGDALAGAEKLDKHCASVGDERVRDFLARVLEELRKPEITDQEFRDAEPVLTTVYGPSARRRRELANSEPPWRGLVDGIVDELNLVPMDDDTHVRTLASAIARHESYLTHGTDAYLDALTLALADPAPLDPFPLGLRTEEELRDFLGRVRAALTEGVAPSDIRRMLDE